MSGARFRASWPTSDVSASELTHQNLRDGAGHGVTGDPSPGLVVPHETAGAVPVYSHEQTRTQKWARLLVLRTAHKLGRVPDPSEVCAHQHVELAREPARIRLAVRGLLRTKST